jgi:hypothetical protein
LKERTLQLFQLFLLIFAFYALVKYDGNERFLVSLACLVTAFLVGKVETRLGEHRKKAIDQAHDLGKKAEVKSTSQALDWLLKSKNVLLVTDAIQCLLKDLGLVVAPSSGNRAVDRVLKIPGMEVTWGITILGHVEDLKENWDKWEEIAAFDQGTQGKRRSLIICSNCITEADSGQQKYRNFPTNTQELLSAKQVVAMTTLTFCKMYLLCKKKGVEINRIFHAIGELPGGVFQVEHLSV